MKQAPVPNQLRVAHIAANYVELAWIDPSSDTYLYVVEYKRPNDTDWTRFGTFTGSSVYVSGLSAEADYHFRVKTRIPLASYQDSEWGETETVTTFAENAFTVSAVGNVEIANNFVRRKLALNDSLTNFNTGDISVALMKEGFAFDPDISNIVDYDSDIVFVDRRQFVFGRLPFVINDKNVAIVGSWEDILYVFHGDTREAFFSTDRAETWTRYFPLLNTTIGLTNDNYSFKASEDRAALVTNRSITLGSTQSTETRWSSTDIKFSNVEERFSAVENEFNIEGGGGGILRFTLEILFPSGINEISSMEIANDFLFITAGGGTVYRVDFQSPEIDGSGNVVFNSDSHQIVNGVDNLYIKGSWAHNDKLYIMVAGEYDADDNIVQSDHSGVWEYDYSTHAFTRVIGDRDSVNSQSCSLSTDGTRLVVSLNVNDETESDVLVSNVTPLRKVYYSVDGTTWFYKPERFALESFYGIFRNDGIRLWQESTARVTAIEDSRQFIQQGQNTSENFTQFGVFNFYFSDRIRFNSYPGFATGLVFYDPNNGNVIAHYEFSYRRRNNVDILLNDGLLLSAQLESISRESIIDSSLDIPIRTLPAKASNSHLLEKIAPEFYIYDENTTFGKFIEFYLQSLSGDEMPVDTVKNLVTNRNPNTTEFMELFTTDLASRNVIDSGQRRLDVLTFLKNHEYDFLTERGTEASYKFMFRALYDVDVEVFVENRRSTESYILVDTDDINLTDVLPGKNIKGPNGRAEVNYVQRVFVDGVEYWLMVLQSLRGTFLTGDDVETVEGDELAGTIFQQLTIRDTPRGKEIASRTRSSFYTIRVEGLSVSRWKNDVLRFVHPVGFNLIGILLLTITANTGLTLRHVETIENVLTTYRWDSGIPTVVWAETADLDGDGDYQYPSDGGFPLTDPNPNGGNTINPDSSYYTDNPEVVYGLTTEERRSANSPLFDATVYRFVNFRRT